MRKYFFGKFFPTHYVNIWGVFSIQRGFGEFKASLIEKYPYVDVNLFQKENKLHLTIGMLYLLGTNEVNKAKKILDKCKDRINNLIGDFEVSEAAFDIQGMRLD